MPPRQHRCRICGAATQLIIDMGDMPPANWLMQSPSQHMVEFPLIMESCKYCRSFQLRDCLDSQTLYRHYNYVTPSSRLLLSHYQRLTSFLEDRGYIARDKKGLEIGSNAGEFLAHLAPRVGSIVGVDPAENVAAMAAARGLPTIAAFFDKSFAEKYRDENGSVDFIAARHCMAHNCDPYAILDGVLAVLSEGGVFIMENAYAIATLKNNEFDQIYHEHMFYYTLTAIQKMFGRVGLALTDVLYSDVHGGSVTCVARRQNEVAAYPLDEALTLDLRNEAEMLRAGLAQTFARSVPKIKKELHDVVCTLRKNGMRIYGYGATAKGATLLNYTKLTSKEIPYCVDSTLIKQGRFMPGCGVEIVSEEWAFHNPPDAFLLTAWNYRDELMAKVASAGLRPTFILPFPSVEVIPGA